MERVSKLCLALAVAVATVVLMLRAPAWAKSASIPPVSPAPVPGSGTPGSGIANTHHDWSEGAHASTFPGNTKITSETGVGLCTYCHTPHHALSTLLLWNQTLSQLTYSWDVPATTAGTTFPNTMTDTYKGPTAKCLSCHDGTVAIGDFNMYETEPATYSGYSSWFSTLSNPMSGNSVARIADNTTYPGSIQTATYNMAGNHPVAMPYPYAGIGSTYNGQPSGPNLVPAQYVSNPLNVLGQSMLYNDDGLGDITLGPVAGKSGIECSSCHDPHNDASVDGLYLVGYLTGNTEASGYICTQCHIK